MNKIKFNTKKNCIVIGTTGLCITVLDCLINNSWCVSYVLSDDVTVKKYCLENNLKLLDYSEIEKIDKYKFALFSIANPIIISDKLLKKYDVSFAINYHDSLLPKYAGINSTTWAIYNGETIHGITWHLITSGIDEGPILKQSIIRITPQETAYSLNTKCFEQATKDFPTLLQDIEKNNVLIVEQDITKKSYYGKNYIPENYGFLNFNDTYEKIHRIFRSLYFGENNHQNPVATMKIWDGKKAYIVGDINFEKNSTALQGYIYTISTYGLCIGINGGILNISKIINGEGNPVSIADTCFKEKNIINSYVLAEEEKNYLSAAKKSESNILKIISTDSYLSTSLFHKSLTKKDKKIYHSIKLIEKNPSLIIQKISLILFKITNQDLCIPVIHQTLNNSKLIQTFISKKSFIFLKKKYEENSVSHLFKKIKKQYSEKFSIPDDFYYRYNIKTNNHDICVHVLKKYHRKTYDFNKFYRLNIIIDDANLYIEGFNEDNLLINSIFSSIRYLLNELKESVFSIHDTVQNINIISPKILRKITYNWNNTKKNYSSDKTIHQLFEEQVVKTPDNIALIYKNKNLTYKELNIKANQLSNYIKITYKTNIDDLIILCLNRSEHMLIAILAVLKTGSAYIPIDPNYPDDRIKYILDDTNSKLILTNELYQKRLNAICSSVQILAIDNSKTQKILQTAPSFNPSTLVSGNNLAYVMYTSGTTGRPKGVMLEHKGIVNRIQWMNDTYPLKETDKILQKTPYVFDVSVWELFWANWYGACIVFIEPERHKDVNYVIELMNNQSITVTHFVPSMLNIFEEALKDAFKKHKFNSIPSLRYVFCSGETLYLTQVKEFHRLLPNAEIHNLYGPTEASIDVLHYSCVDKNITEIYLGKPINNTQIYVLDNHQKLLPIGVIGELHIGGIGLARGYLNQPDLTTEKFIINPFQMKEDKKIGKNEKLYKTGDLGYWLSDGNIKYVGRNDFQVKINGLRIELSEIENILSSYIGIKQSIVLAKNKLISTDSTNIHLVAYYLSETTINDDNLREYLASILPEYMIPSFFLRIDSIPLTTNGKIDRKALPDPKIKIRKNYIAPRTELEKTLCHIWQEVLEIEKIGINDNFFMIGGDSIFSIRIITRLNHIGLELSVKDIFEYKTIANIIPRLSKKRRNSDYQPFSLISTDALQEIIYSDLNLLEDAYPVSYLQFGMLLESDLSHDGTYHDVFSYRIGKKFSKNKFLSVWSKLIIKHALLRSSFHKNQKYGYLSFQYKNLSLKKVKEKILFSDEKSIESIIQHEKLENFSYDNPGLFRLIVAKKNKDHFFLVFSFHHCIADGWSVNSLISEFVDLYVHDKPLENYQTYPIYINFLINEREASKNPSFYKFWKNYIDGYEYNNSNFIIHSNEKNLTDMVQANHVLEKEKSEKLLAIANRLGISIDTIFLSTYQLLLSTFYNKEDLIIGLIINNRPEEEDGDKVFGLFLNAIPFRMTINNDIYELIKNTYQEKLKIHAFKAYPYAKIKSDLKLRDDVYKCSFNYIHFHVSEKNNNSGSMDYATGFGYISGFEKTNIPLMFHVMRQKDQFKLQFNGHSNFIDSKTINKFIKFINGYLEQIISGSQKINRITEEEYQQVIYANNCTKKIYNNSKTIYEIFEEQANKNPNRIAVVSQNLSVTHQTYGELNKRANQLAHYLKEKGVFSEVSVAVYMPRNIELIITLLAIWKAGGVYVPLDPDYPHLRLKEIISINKIKILITTNELFIKLQNYIDINLKSLIKLDRLSKKLLKYSENNLDISTKLNNLAYILHTSGTTGQPKGVAQEHKTLINLTHWQTSIFPKKYIRKITQIANIVFDVSLQEICYALANGYELHIISNTIKQSLRLLINYIVQESINQIFLPTALLEPFCEAASISKIELPHLTDIMISGEALKISALIKDFFIYYPHINLINEYGPTETHVASIYRLPQNVQNWPVRPPIGTPIYNTQLYVLDKNFQPVPQGVPGELYIGGTNLARLYVANHAQTCEKFILNPFVNKNTNLRLYKTGDQAIWRTDGQLEYLGRLDQQIKIRGHRVEPNEIESQVLKCSGARQCVVIPVYDKKTTQPHLVCYLVSEFDTQKNTSSLLAELTKILPNYMIPSHFIWLEKLPLTNNGKIDKKSLPQPVYTATRKETLTTLRNMYDRELLKICSEIFNITELNVNDDFFEVGAHSLSALRLLVAIEKKFNICLSITDLLKAPTVIQLSNKIQNLQINLFLNHSEVIKYNGQEIPYPIVPLQILGHKKPLFIIHPAGGTVFGFVDLARYMGIERPIYGIQDPAAIGKEHNPIFYNIEELTAFYLFCLRKVQPTGPYLIGGSSFGATVAFEMAKQLIKNKERVDFIGLLDGWAFYPTELQNKKNFRQIMYHQYQDLRKRFQKYELENSDSWINLQWQRGELLWQYKLTCLNAKLTLFKAQELPTEQAWMNNSENYWHDYTTQPIKVYLTPGNHETILKEPHVQILAKQMNQALEEAENTTKNLVPISAYNLQTL